MNPFDYVMIAALPCLLIFFLYSAYENEKEKAERIRERDDFDKEFEETFEEWSMDPSKENEEKLNKMLEDIHGQDV